ncbi:outer membrane usher protein [Serratia oryzae]|uniref:outer membrane usher protein n=1 Tax=Serratia oryzae TaxID=2034155 RepID=UPI0012E1C925|nr:outer membrane usher protein [Serratia oryzae]
MITPPSKARAPRTRLLTLLIALALLNGQAAYAKPIEFNSEVLDLQDRSQIDLERFSRAGYVMPGDYRLEVRVNQLTAFPEQTIVFHPAKQDPQDSEPCLPPTLVENLGLKPEALRQLLWSEGGKCLVLGSIEGLTARADLGAGALYLSVPQIYLEYSAEDWDPPSRWDEGIPGLLLDYSVNGQTQRQANDNRVQKGYSLNGSGVVGANAGSWRLRASWQSAINHQTGSGQSTSQNFDWTQYTAYRALPNLGAKLTLGEDFLNSSIFDGFRFAGVNLATDDAMLPPNLRGYAPEVSGVARTNARVVVSQQGRVLQETLVAPGPFRIQDLNNAVTGQLDVKVEEQDGSVQSFTVSTANIPYLTRPGRVRYQLSAGRPTDFRHHMEGPAFVGGEFSWGVSNGWSLYGGLIGGEKYNSLAMGIGRDLMALGALSFDITRSRADLPGQIVLAGNSFRLNYAKRFDEINGQLSFAAYRFSERNFMNMTDYLTLRNRGEREQSGKERYSVAYNQPFEQLGVSASLNYNHDTYWDRGSSDYWGLSLTRYFDLGKLKNVSLSLTGYRNQLNGKPDDGLYLSLSMPWGNAGSISYSGTLDRRDNTHRVTYADQINDRSHYQVSSGWNRQGGLVNGYFRHDADWAQINATAGSQPGSYTSVGLGVQGGITATREGVAAHRVSMPGGTRLLLDTDGVPGIPIRGYGAALKSNRYGKAVVADINNYYRNQVNIDLDQLPENAEASTSVVMATLTEGAIGYRKFDVVAGEKAMAVIRLADGRMPPFGAQVINHKQREVGIVNDGGQVYLSGIARGEKMTVHWDDRVQCELTLPSVLPSALDPTDLLLPCRELSGGTSNDLAARRNNPEKSE